VDNSPAVIATAARRLDPAIQALADIGEVRSVEIDDKNGEVAVVIRVRLDRKARKA
jgi:metal-sulfur cluster biosynthetic enzyme